jgi:hypothetical protein
MKKLLSPLLFSAVIVLAGCEKDDETEKIEDSPTPALAASTQTWTFGKQIWSDVIHCPDCDKETFENSDTKPDCRSYTDTESGKTFYYYNWTYVSQNATTLCPPPWRVPTVQDFKTLTNNATSATLHTEWGYGGFAFGSPPMTNTSTSAYYWSSTQNSSNTNYVHYLYYNSSNLSVISTFKNSGFQVRCVR